MIGVVAKRRAVAIVAQAFVFEDDAQQENDKHQYWNQAGQGRYRKLHQARGGCADGKEAGEITRRLVIGLEPLPARGHVEMIAMPGRWIVGVGLVIVAAAVFSAQPGRDDLQAAQRD